MACRARQAPPPCTPMVGYGGAEPSMGSACNGTGGAGSKRTKKKKTSSIYIYIYARVLGRKEQRAVGGRKGMPRWKRRNEAPLLALLFLFFSILLRPESGDFSFTGFGMDGKREASATNCVGNK